MKTTSRKTESSDLAIFLANEIRSRRLRVAITQADLAARAGITVETIARLERVLRGRASANANPSLETLERIASALGCHPADLIETRLSKTKASGDPIAAMVRVAKPATRVWIASIVEACLRTEKNQRKAG
jgi:transcriptional regulator with XRE-family HTH domain